MGLREDSKYMSYILRHNPGSVGLQLLPGGWVSIPDLLEAVEQHGHPLSRERLTEVVATSDKQRFAIDDVADLIRANQGHSVPVDLGLVAMEPPEFLFHGTAQRFLGSIEQRGLVKQQRHHVHMSADHATALEVGTRHGKPVVLRVSAGAMHAAGALFYRSANGVWLTEAVPPEHLTKPRNG